MGRFYMHCFHCRARMRKFREDVEGDRMFYHCRNCGRRCTYMLRLNGVSDDWPKEVIDEAVAAGLFSRGGRLL